MTTFTAQSLVGRSERVQSLSFEMRQNRNGVHMPLYEHVFISRQDLSNAQAEGLIEHFGTVLSDNGGKLLSLIHI